MTTLQLDRIVLEYDLTFTMPFHFGTGLRSSLLDRTVVRDRNGYLYVPASTIKGVWREKCEVLERMYTGSDLVDTPHDAKKALWGLGGNITMCMRIFGSQQYPGQLFFEDALLAKKELGLLANNPEDESRNRNLQTSNYTQVRLERSTRTSVPGALYTSEFGQQNFLFKGSVNGWLNCTPTSEEAAEPTYSLLLLLTGLYLLERLGGNKSTGKGACTCEITLLKINDQKIEKKQWQGWMNNLEVLTQYDYKSQEEA